MPGPDRSTSPNHDRRLRRVSGATPAVLREAAVEGYITAFWWAGGIFALGAPVCGGLLQSGVRPEMAYGAAGPAVAQ